MTQFAEVWHFTRARLEQAMQGLTHEQMCWRPHSEAHTIFELLYHIAGAEYYWAIGWEIVRRRANSSGGSIGQSSSRSWQRESSRSEPKT
jgi:hypothetical protein